ncbi:MAG: hypothetical protein ABIG96_00690 [Candidatus Micrarchaeota archaeon]
MRFIAVLMAILMALLPSIADFTETATFFNAEGELAPNITITNVTLSSSPLYAGSSTDFIIMLTNAGDLAGNASANLTIYNSTGDPVYTLSYDPVIISPFSSNYISQSWSTAGFSVGLYYANATALYNDGSNITNSFIRAFSIASAPVVQPGGPGGGTGYNPPPGVPVTNGSTYVPRPVPTLTPTSTNMRFIKTTLLKEMAAGASVFETFVVKNIAGTEARPVFRISGVPEQWISYSPSEAVMLLNEDRAINIGLNIPPDALAGDYTLQIEAVEGNAIAVDYMVVRVKPSRSDLPFPQVFKTVRLNRLLGNTEIAIDVSNPTQKRMESILVTEHLLPGFKAVRDDLIFDNKPPLDVTDSNPIVIRWRIEKLEPGELTRISYSVNSLLSEYRPYVYWTAKQVEFVPQELQLADLIVVREIKASQISEGGTGEVTAKIFYAGFDDIEFKAVLEVPEGFEANPVAIYQKLMPRGYTVIKFMVKSPKQSLGTHTITLTMLLNDNQTVQGTGYIEVGGPVSVSMQLFLFVVVSVVAVTLGILHFLGRKKSESERNHAIEMRSGYINQIKNHLKNK